MKLDEYIRQHPRNQRGEVTRRIADHCGVSAVLVKSWANGSRKIQLDHFESLAEVTNQQVTIFDYHPGLHVA